MLTTSFATVGVHQIAATYLGSTGFAPSSAAINQVVKGAPVATHTAISTSANPAFRGDVVTFTIVATPVDVAVGTVDLIVDRTIRDSAQLQNGGATFTTTLQATGTLIVQAMYRGSADAFASSASVTHSVHCWAPPPSGSEGSDRCSSTPSTPCSWSGLARRPK